MKDKLTYVTPQDVGELPPPKTKITFADKKKVIFDSASHIKAVIEEQKLRGEADPSQNRCEVRIKTDLPFILVVGSSDWHLGSEHCDYEMFWKHYNLIKDTDGVFVNIIGDERDNFVMPKLRAGLFEEVLNPQQQADLFQGLLQGWDDKGKILARCGGNHDNFSWMEVGVNIENYWYQDMKSPLMRVGGFEHLKLNKIEYVGWLHHGLSVYNSTFNPNHASRRSFEMQGPFDFSMMGHTHQEEVSMGWRWSEEYAKRVCMVRTGTYKTDDTYAKSRQFPRGQEPGACILFDTREKRMMGFDNINSGIEALVAMNTYQQLVAAGMLGIK